MLNRNKMINSFVSPRVLPYLYLFLQANRTTDALAIAKFSGNDDIYNRIFSDYL